MDEMTSTGEQHASYNNSADNLIIIAKNYGES